MIYGFTSITFSGQDKPAGVNRRVPEQTLVGLTRPERHGRHQFIGVRRCIFGVLADQSGEERTELSSVAESPNLLLRWRSRWDVISSTAAAF
jgi:hypothetical protein